MSCLCLCQSCSKAEQLRKNCKETTKSAAFPRTFDLYGAFQMRGKCTKSAHFFVQSKQPAKKCAVLKVRISKIFILAGALFTALPIQTGPKAVVRSKTVLPRVLSHHPSLGRIQVDVALGIHRSLSDFLPLKHLRRYPYGMLLVT